MAVIAHSYGGVPTTEGAGNAQYLIYVASFALDIGESLLAAAGGEPPSWWDVQGPLVIAGNETQTPQDIFFGDIDDEMAAAIVPRLRAQGLLSMSQPLTRAAWRDIPSTYVIAENDAAIPAFVQEQLAARIGARVERLATSHSPFLSQPDAVADIIESALGSAS